MAERSNCIIISDEDDELNLLNANSETILPKKKPLPDEVIPDSEEDEPLKSLPIIPPPHTPLRQRKPQQQQLDDCPSSPLSPLPVPEKKKKRKLLRDVTLPSVEVVRKKAKPSKEAIASPQETDKSDSPRLSAEKPSSPAETATHTPKPRAKPRPKPKAKAKKHKEGSDTISNVQETALAPPSPPHIDRQSPERSKAPATLPSKEIQQSRLENDIRVEALPLKSKSNGKEKHYHAKENPTQTAFKLATDDSSPSVNTFPPKKNNRPLTDILRNLNNSSPYTRRFSPAVSRNFLTRIAPLHPNRREPPPPPPRIIPKKTKKELEREEKWEEELQDEIPNWCELTEEERQRFRKEKRDWVLGLYEE